MDVTAQPNVAKEERNKALLTNSKMAQYPSFAENALGDISQVGTWQRITDGFGDTALASAYDYVSDQISMGVSLTPNYDKQKMAAELTKDVPFEYWDNVLGYDNLEQAQAARARVLADNERHSRMAVQRGTSSSIAMLAGGFLDVDAPLMFVPGLGEGVGAAKVAKAGYMGARALGLSPRLAVRAAGLLEGASAGAQMGALAGAVQAGTDDTAGVSTVLMNVLGGGAMGAGFGLMSTRNGVKAAIEMRNLVQDNAIIRPMTSVDTEVATRATEGAYMQQVFPEVAQDGKQVSTTGMKVQEASTVNTQHGYVTILSEDMPPEEYGKVAESYKNAYDKRFDVTDLDAVAMVELDLTASAWDNPADPDTPRMTGMELQRMADTIETMAWDDITRIYGDFNTARAHINTVYDRLEQAGLGDMVRPVMTKEQSTAHLGAMFRKNSPTPEATFNAVKAGKALINALRGDRAPRLGSQEKRGGGYWNSNADVPSHPLNNVVTVGEGLTGPQANILFHEVGHWAFHNMMTISERRQFWDAIAKYEIRQPNGDSVMATGTVASMLPDKGKLTNSMKTIQEFWTNQFDMWVNRQLRAAGHGHAAPQFWQRLMGYIGDIYDAYMGKAPIDKDFERLFNQLVDVKVLRGETPAPVTGKERTSAMDTIRQSVQASIGNRERPMPKVEYIAVKQATFGAIPEPEQKFIDYAKDWMVQSGAKAMLDNLSNTPWGRMMTGNWLVAVGGQGKVMDGVNTAVTRFANSVGNDVMRMYRSKSSAANWFALNIFESPSSYGRGVVASTAATLDAIAFRSIGSTIKRWDFVVNEWAKTTGNTWKAGQQALGVGITRAGAQSLYREVMLSMNDIRMGRGPRSGNNHHIAQLITMMQEHSKASLDWLKGDDPNFTVLGMENVDYDPGYVPQRANGDAIYGLIQKGRTTLDDVHNAFAEGYERAGLDKDTAMIIAKANVGRAWRRAADVDTSMIDMLTEDGRGMLRERLILNGMTEVQADSILEKLTGMVEERGKLGFAKHRNDLDMDTRINTTDGSDLRLVDLMDYDLPNMLQRYRKGVAGSGALARKGIRSRKELDVIISAMNAEMRELGEDGIHQDHMRAMVSDFFAGPSHGYMWGQANKGIDPVISVAKRIANLSLLGNLGISQLMDHANLIAADGLQSWWKHAMTRFGTDQRIKNMDASLMDDLIVLTGDIGADHHIFREHTGIDEISERDSGAFMKGLRNLTGNLSYVQGYTSMFNTVRGHQQKVAATILANKVLRAIKNGTLNERLQFDFGITPELHAFIKGKIDDGTIEFKAVDGREYVNRLNPEQWSGQAQQDFGSIITRALDTSVMRNLPGELDAWMRSPAGALITHLKTFPLTAIPKQLMRNGRFMDQQTAGTMMWGMALAYLILKVQDQVFGRDLSERDQAMRAIGYSNMTGWIPMVVDPTMTMLGLDEYRMQRYGRYYETTLPTVEVANRLLRAPGAAGKLLFGGEHLNGDDKQALLAIPFLKTAGIGEWIVRNHNDAIKAGE